MDRSDHGTTVPAAVYNFSSAFVAYRSPYCTVRDMHRLVFYQNAGKSKQVLVTCIHFLVVIRLLVLVERREVFDHFSCPLKNDNH